MYIDTESINNVFIVALAAISGFAFIYHMLIIPLWFILGYCIFKKLWDRIYFIEPYEDIILFVCMFIYIGAFIYILWIDWPFCYYPRLPFA